MDKKEKIQFIATQLQNLLPIIDMVAVELENDIDLLDEAANKIKEKISHNEAALPIITALGGSYDSAEDKCKLKTLQCLIDFIKVRNEYKQTIEKQQMRRKANFDALKLFGL